jgi:hypothetical protein
MTMGGPTITTCLALIVAGSMATTAARAASENVLYRFSGGADGANPGSALIYTSGKLFGTTSSVSAGTGNGTVFSVTLSGKEKTIYAFAGGTDGELPDSPLTEIDGIFYGATLAGGSTTSCAGGGCGTAYAVSPHGKEKIIRQAPAAASSPSSSATNSPSSTATAPPF